MQVRSFLIQDINVLGTKAGAELLVQSYYKSFGLPTIITRGNNVYGPKQFPEKLIPKFICLLAKKKPVPIHGSGENRRNFIYISDVVSAFDTILHKGTIGQIYNIGTDTEVSNLKVAESLLKIFGLEESKEGLIQFVDNRPFNDFRYLVNFDKLSQLGWSPKVQWEEGLQKTVDWYLEILNQNQKWWEDIDKVLVAHPRMK